jgi:hypothetical protein
MIQDEWFSQIRKNRKEKELIWVIICPGKMSRMDAAKAVLKDEGKSPEEIKAIIDKAMFTPEMDKLVARYKDGLKENEETQVRTVVKEIIRQELNENVQKRLKEIEEESQYEVLSTKADKIQKEIEVREARINRINEDEDFADLLDKNKIKNLKKEIKVLQKAANKVN